MPKEAEPGPGLVYIPESKLDSRSDDEIANELKSYKEITPSDKNVWAFWNNGFDSMYPWTQRNVINWVRRLGPSWTVRVLDKVPGSPVHVSKFIPANQLPEAFNNNEMTGHNIGPHSGDMVRLPLLYLHGGVWMDVGMMLFRHLDDMCWKAIEDPASPYEMAGMSIEINPGATNMLNGFIAAQRGNGFIKRWHDIYLEVWKNGRTEQTGLHKHPLLTHLPILYAPTNHLNLPGALKVSPEDFSDYLGHFQSFERLRKLVDPADGFDGPRYHRENIFMLPAMTETWKFQLLTAWNGKRQFELLSAKRDTESSNKSDLYNEANGFVLDLLANTSTMKLSHGPPGALDSFLADIWDHEDNHDKDIETGTFAAFLRYGSVHFDQVRAIHPVPVPLSSEEVFNISVLEPYDG
ncbi:hypothetical protein PISL3812_06199 [Talaromyces islandicus]|uniref:Capsule polysaccharide biosynthesis protein n=1 Tax=Talaromyces islandicus TaxID=28573 RepID=A0A0U1M0V4_TALIS|nr:hypothetical protein PISL3812_06199 [Talaromyces islandicus]